jgi:glycosyltransferase involved in cell wall biosynthesis
MIGVDLGQFALDPFGSGVQRVLQQLALHWPSDIAAEFLVPVHDGFGALSPIEAYDLVSSPFRQRLADHDAPRVIAERIQELQPRRLAHEEIVGRYSSWLMPEMSYDPITLARLRAVSEEMPLVMIGHDALPMSDPANYLFTPGTHAHVSEYFRILRDAHTVVCTSDFTRGQMFDVLRRDRALRTVIANPGGDHVSMEGHARSSGRPVLLRLGTMEARKRPAEITEAFTGACAAGLDAELVFVGSPSRVDVAINTAVERAIAEGHPIRWVTHAADDEVLEWMRRATAFLSFGIEGYGLPVLEAIRRGLPVIFDGIQPAAEIMEGRGALRRTLSFDPDDWRAYAEDAAAAAPDASGVPRWTDFARSVAEAAD